MTTKHVVADDKFGLVAKRCQELQRRVLEGTLDPDVVAEVLQRYIEGRFGGQNEFLKLISGDERLVVGPADGSETLDKANDLFAYIDSDLKNYGANDPSGATDETAVSVYELVRNATFAQMFGSLSPDLSRLCLTHAQIKGFVKAHRQWLRTDGYVTFFLFKSLDQFFVAFVFVRSDGRLEVDVNRFENSRVWSAEFRHRLVVPQLA